MKRDVIEPMSTTLRATITRYRLLEPGQTVVVAVSGGPDSTALLHALSGLRVEWELNLVVAHLNHGFRGRKRRPMRRMLPNLRPDWIFPVVFGTRMFLRCECGGISRHRKRPGRLVMRFYGRSPRKSAAQRIALGHTRDDRVETFLLNLLRGAGLDGLGGFPPADFPLIRPLYTMSRAETEAYCATHGLQPRYDSSNTCLDYRRNRVRAELLPMLRQYYNAKVDDALLRLSDLAVADNSF